LSIAQWSLLFRTIIVILYSMRMRNRKTRYWLGHLLMATMLFTQSALLWAQMAVPVQSHQHMQQGCDKSQLAHTDSGHEHCKQDCCSHDHVCTGSCLSDCMTGGVILLPMAMTSVLPYFNIISTHLTLNLPPDGMHTAVLERPPRNFA